MHVCMQAMHTLVPHTTPHRESSNLLCEATKLADFEVKSDYRNAKHVVNLINH